jgi:hypothetical protein
MSQTSTVERFQIQARADHLFIEVPLHEAERIHDCFVRQGVNATLCLEPYDRAGLDLPNDFNVEKIRQLLVEYDAAQVA